MQVTSPQYSNKQIVPILPFHRCSAVNPRERHGIVVGEVVRLSNLSKLTETVGCASYVGSNKRAWDSARLWRALV